MDHGRSRNSMTLAMQKPRFTTIQVDNGRCANSVQLAMLIAPFPSVPRCVPYSALCGMIRFYSHRKANSICCASLKGQVMALAPIQANTSAVISQPCTYHAELPSG